jgi:redox-sensitive bicupin YhaK (pirin superfamily)
MKKIFHASSTRGEANHGWLHAKHSFSFANYFDPKRIQFGALRVLNDDIIAPGMGFGSHPHDNMEIITIPLEGALEHKDSMDNIGVIEADEIQVMSAGTGIFHSEYNKNKDKEVKVLQLWVLPKEKNVTPRYDQKSIKELKKINTLYPIVTPRSKWSCNVDSSRCLVSYGRF